ncbi:MAG: thioredoxin [Dysgonamonadaceae bacterium]|jgi:thioredoxin|nr:thioredoxin [Dysgonamonadaceae bacterium]
MKKNLLIIAYTLGFAVTVFSQKSDIVPLTKADFLTEVFNYEKNPGKWIYEGKKPCIIDFYADWCAPCRKLSPILADLATKYKGKIIVYKIDTDKERELAQSFGISSIPTLFFIPLDGNPQVTRGLLSKDDLEKIINEVLIK